jgi:hypothetical protein
MLKKLVLGLLAGAFLFSSVPVMAIPAPNDACVSVELVIANVQAREPQDEFVVLNEQQMNAFRARDDLMPPPDVDFDRVLIIHDAERALVVLLKGDCVVRAANNTVPWVLLARILGLTQARNGMNG